MAYIKICDTVVEVKPRPRRPDKYPSVRVFPRTHKRLRQISDQTGVTMVELLATAVDAISA